MANRTKVLVVDSNLDNLSRIYLALVHRNFKAEASDKAEEIVERLGRLKPALIILGKKEYISLKEKIRIPGIVLIDKGDANTIQLNDEFIAMENPVKIEALIRTIEELVI